MVITPGKNFEGQKGFPTPSDIPSDTACRSFVLPDNDEWFGLLMGAVELLLNPHNYYNYGALSIDDTVDAWQLIIQNAYDRSLLGTCDPTVGAPWWDEDSADDADDEMDVAAQIWYGQIVESTSLLVAEDVTLTFLDNLGIWAIAGFIAYAGQPGAAIAFVPIAQKFVLSFKQHSLGGVVRALVDFLHIADIDTYGVEDGVANLSIVMPDDGMPHTLYVELSDDNPHGLDNPNVQVIRKRLTADEVTPPNVRWNSDCNCLQTTPDGGTTWVDTPETDPRYSPGGKLPGRGGSDPRCDAAANMVAKLKTMVNIFEQELAQVQAANALLDVILLLLPGVGWVIDALLAATELLLTIGADAISTAFTDDQWQIVLCILDCSISPDGTVTQAQFDTILDKMHVQCNTVVYDVLYTLFTLSLGPVGLSNAGATGTETGDCSACDATFDHCFDFSIDQQGWTIFHGAWGGDPPKHFGGGIDGGSVYIDIGIGMPLTTITDIYIMYAVDNVRGDQPSADLYISDVLQAFRNSGYAAGTNHAETIHYTFDNVDANQIRVNVGSDSITTCNIYSIEVKGLCADPF